MKRTGSVRAQILLIFAAGIAVSVLGCDIFHRDFSATGLPPGTGALVLTFHSTLPRSKTLEPPISMEPVSYVIEGTGPVPATDHFQSTLIPDELDADEPLVLEVEDLRWGEWTVTAEARNGDGTLIGRGETSVYIEPAKVTVAEILVTPLSGTGGLSLSVQWSSWVHRGVTVEASLVSASTGKDLKPKFQVSSTLLTTTAAYSNPAIEAGYYLLQLRLTDRAGQSWGVAEAVRIVADQTTTQGWTWD